MTREEQIKQAGIEYTYRNRPMCIGGGAFSEMVDEMNRNKPFEEGAKWADATMIEKACEWLRQHHEDYYQYDAWGGECVNLTTLIQDFKKSYGKR